MYIRDHYGSLARPVKELKGFELLELNPGETKEVSFEIDNSKLVYYTANDRWESETGKFSVLIGADSDVKDNKSFDLIPTPLTNASYANFIRSHLLSLSIE